MKRAEIISKNGVHYYDRILNNCRKTNKLLRKIIENNIDIMFLLKSHPGDGLGKTSLEFKGLQDFPNVNFGEK